MAGLINWKKSTQPTISPASDHVYVGVDTTDGKLFLKDSTGTVKKQVTSDIQIIAGAGLTGGGDLSANRTIAHVPVGTAGTYGGASGVLVLTTDSVGHVTNVSPTPIAILSSAVTNFTASVLGTILTGLSTATSSTALAADTLLVALGKIQAQINTINAIDFSGMVRTTVLTGYTVGSTTALAASDTVLGAFGKLQALINDLQNQVNVWDEVLGTNTVSTNSAITASNVTDFTMSVLAGKVYYIEFTFAFQSTATGTGIALSIGATGAAGNISLLVTIPAGADGTGSSYQGTVTSFGDFVVGSGVETANRTYVAKMQGTFNCTTSGTIYPQFRSKTSLVSVSIQPGSVALFRQF